MATPPPPDEADRLEAAARHADLDNPPDAELDRITRLAARMFETPIALIALVDRERHWFKSHHGFDLSQTTRDDALCVHTILENRVFVLPDAAADPRFIDSPLVTGSPLIRFYAGAPLMASDGFCLGSLGVADTAPRAFSASQAASLADLAAMVIAVFESRRASSRMSAEIAERQRAETALQKSEARKAAILDAALDAIITSDSAGMVMELNPAAETMFGYSAKEAVGQEMAMLIIPPAFRDAHRRGMLHYLATGEGPILNKRLELSAIRADGSEFPIELTIARIAADGPPMFTGQIRDITHRRQVQQALEQARDEAQRANAAKSEFLSRMSHELRTPLNAILGFGQLLEMDAQDEQRELLSHILRGGKHLLTLINEVLDIARIESGRLELTLETIRVDEVFKEAATLIQPLAAQRRVQVGECSGTACGGSVRADRQRLCQVLLNLLSNAVKYNRPGGSVRCACELTTRAGWVRVSISDTGLGITPENMAKLFTPFERLDAEHSGIEGTGIGLALSKRLVEAMGGTIGVDSAPGRGSTFYLELPVADAIIPSAEAPDGPAPANPSAATATVLCIEDNLSNFALVEQVLAAKRPAIRLRGAMQGRLGLDLAREHLPDLILLDLQLPDLPGDEVLQHLQADAGTRGIPVILVSADATTGQAQRLINLGAREYLTKPLDIPDFLRAIDEALASKAPPSKRAD